MSENKVAAKLEGTDFTNIFIAVFVILLTLVVFALYRRKKSSRNCVLITGLCDSGKTLLFSQLLYKKYVQTQTSMKENIGSYIENNHYVKVVDVPGHERLRDKFVEKYKDSTRGIIYVIDSATVQQDIRDVAEYLYTLLADPSFARYVNQVLIVCNKQDQTLAKGSNVIKSILEKELNTLRVTKSNQLDSVDPKSNNRFASLGDTNKDFTFYALHAKVDFVETIAYDKESGVKIDDVHQWLSKIA